MPSVAHVVFIPGVLLIGMVIGYVLGARAAREELERRRKARRQLRAMTTGASLLPLREGDVLEGKYRIEHLLGEGGMGAVYRAQHLVLDEPVAIKVLLPTQLHRPDAAARFLREGRAASKIKSSHVARVLDVGALDSGLPFLVMEFLEGEDLAARIQRLGCLATSDVVRWVLQACEAMAEAHSKGVIHRDLKPSNLFLARRHDGSEIVKVLDFGISKFNGTMTDGVRTASRAILGSPFYMAPEQMSSSGQVDQRADLWSLGCILFESLAGQPPFVADDVTILVARVLHDPTPSLSALRPDVPPALVQVIERCLAKRVQERMGSVSELIAALQPFASLPTPSIAPRLVDAPPDTVRQPTPPESVAPSAPRVSSGPPPPPPTRSPLGLVLAILMLAVAVLAGALAVRRSQEKTALELPSATAAASPARSTPALPSVSAPPASGAVEPPGRPSATPVAASSQVALLPAPRTTPAASPWPVAAPASALPNPVKIPPKSTPTSVGLPPDRD